MIDYVIKIGGSLLYRIPDMDCLLDKLTKNKVNAVFTIGSGYFGEVFKDFLKSNELELGFEAAVNCWSNIQSVNANIITGINNNFKLCNNIREIKAILTSGKLPIVNTIFFHHLLKDLLLQTADLRSAFLGFKLKCKKIIIITDVNGIFDSDPKKYSNAKKIKSIRASELSKMGRTSIDNGLAEKLIEYNMTAYVIGIKEYIELNQEVESFIQSQGTIIYP